jgi:predicted 3-demethylubiquinone-9 3-methyltransferase (glyoxalase superfamily)|nr:VOC family protein [Kofleriaceae bacterium]
MTEIVTFLTFREGAEHAARFYCDIFPGSKIRDTSRYPDVSVASTPGSVMVVEIELFGRRYVLLNGGEHFKFNDGISLMVPCDTQAEIDRYWDALLADGGKPVACGWLTDKFGVSWQVCPRDIGALYAADPKDPARPKRVMEAMMKMVKMDLATLQKAARNEL